ncbi:hypothetical protein Tco_1496834 [Tanacetum coccineum]
MIQDMIGILMGSIAVTEVPTTTTEFPYIVEWRQMYNTYTDARKHTKDGLVYISIGNNEENEKRIQRISRFWRTTTTHGVVVEDQTPLMKSWDTMKLKLRENEELGMGGFGRLRIKEAYRYVEKPRLTKGKIRVMKNSPEKDQGDILRHVYTPKNNFEDGVFEDVEGSKKMEAIKQFQKRTAEVN